MPSACPCQVWQEEEGFSLSDEEVAGLTAQTGTYIGTASF